MGIAIVHPKDFPFTCEVPSNAMVTKQTCVTKALSFNVIGADTSTSQLPQNRRFINDLADGAEGSTGN